eukprot:119147-Alexandrium_andersonii.AAC.1
MAAGPETASKSAPDALEGWILCRCARCRICRRNRPAGAPEALLRGVRGDGAPPLGSPMLRNGMSIEPNRRTETKTEIEPTEP